MFSFKGYDFFSRLEVLYGVFCQVFAIKNLDLDSEPSKSLGPDPDPDGLIRNTDIQLPQR
jgi:hypothetical protein